MLKHPAQRFTHSPENSCNTACVPCRQDSRIGIVRMPFPRQTVCHVYLSAYNVIAKSRGQLHAVYIITEYAQGGDLLKLLLRTETPLGWRFRIQIAKEVFIGGLGVVYFSLWLRRSVAVTKFHSLFDCVSLQFCSRASKARCNDTRFEWFSHSKIA